MQPELARLETQASRLTEYHAWLYQIRSSHKALCERAYESIGKPVQPTMRYESCVVKSTLPFLSNIALPLLTKLLTMIGLLKVPMCSGIKGAMKKGSSPCNFASNSILSKPVACSRSVGLNTCPSVLEGCCGSRLCRLTLFQAQHPFRAIAVDQRQLALPQRQ